MRKLNLTYSDIPFFVSRNAFTGDLNKVTDINAIKQSLKNIVLTIKREKPFNFLFGGNPREFLFETLDPVVSMNCKNLIGSAINTFEPRVSIKDIIIYQVPKNPNKINVVIPFTIVQTQTNDLVSISIERTR